MDDVGRSSLGHSPSDNAYVRKAYIKCKKDQPPCTNIDSPSKLHWRQSELRHRSVEMITQTIILITGTKAGIGHGLLKHYASLPKTTVIAAIRDEPSSRAAQDMVSYITTLGPESRIIPVQYDASLTDSARNIVDVLKADYPEISHLDLVIANAAYNNQWGPSLSVSADDLSSHFTINSIAPIMLYQAVRPLLLASPDHVVPRFFYVSTVAASIESVPWIPFPIIAYGLSKAAGNYFIRKANNEEERLTLVALHPGWVQTDAGNTVARKVGRGKAPLSVQECCAKLSAIMDRATRTEMGGTFQSVDGGTLPW